MLSSVNFTVYIKNQHYEVEKFCNDVVNLIQYSISEGYTHVMNIFKDVNGIWRADQNEDNSFIKAIGLAIDYHENLINVC